ncbi:tRNA (adenosine(37)-N6)-threonylcarbamoyltransferase complex dimerization subunit type 1 TsaB [Verrucomicrobium spinosum]|uniref:tRNA (adenosine(37)-N6)-threonylcarbamoyltransferase complex dimerization subunit type 1 TsaB n=1 Tax=Verrucomicrobium spinosum TaxID=2736 RepID=UPI0001745114|nr:tRNA (adenosine(37)-N6)-threonylcarbamoyltransferase complex dimerization subunit type 1 TsaB [Verrucomicrobium spinosum]
MSACILALETSTPQGQVALWQEEEVVYAKAFSSQRSHNSQLFAPLEEALELAGDALDLIVVGTGPGSYTGVRIGIAAAQGLGWARGVPVIGLCSLLAPEVEVVPDHYVMCGDARRGLFYAVQIQRGALRVGEIPLMGKNDFVRFQEAHREVPWYTLDAVSPAELEGVVPVRPSAVGLARLAAGLSAENVAEWAAAALEPVYLSAPFITKANPLRGGQVGSRQ